MDALGINPILLIAQIISFVVLFVVLNKLLYAKVRKALEERRELIKHTMVVQQVTDQRLKELEAERIALEKKNSSEVRALLATAAKEAEKSKKEMLEAAEEKGQKMIEEAKKRIEEEKTRATDELTEAAKLLAKEMASKVLSAQGKNGKNGVDESILELKKVNAKK